MAMKNINASGHKTTKTWKTWKMGEINLLKPMIWILHLNVGNWCLLYSEIKIHQYDFRWHTNACFYLVHSNRICHTKVPTYGCPQGTNVPFTCEYLATRQNFTGILWTLRGIWLQSTVVLRLLLKQTYTVVHLKASIVGFHGYIRGVKAECCSAQSRSALSSMCTLSLCEWERDGTLVKCARLPVNKQAALWVVYHRVFPGFCVCVCVCVCVCRGWGGS